MFVQRVWCVWGIWEVVYFNAFSWRITREERGGIVGLWSEAGVGGANVADFSLLSSLFSLPTILFQLPHFLLLHFLIMLSDQPKKVPLFFFSILGSEASMLLVVPCDFWIVLVLFFSFWVLIVGSVVKESGFGSDSWNAVPWNECLLALLRCHFLFYFSHKNLILFPNMIFFLLGFLVCSSLSFFLVLGGIFWHPFLHPFVENPLIFGFYLDVGMNWSQF